MAFLNESGLQKLWAKIKANFAKIDGDFSADEIIVVKSKDSNGLIIQSSGLTLKEVNNTATGLDEVKGNIQTINGNITTLQEGLATKADKVTGATEDNLAILKADGNLKDSGIAKSTVATKTEVQAAATAAANAQSAADDAAELAGQKTTMTEVETVLNNYATKAYADTAETDAINTAKGYTDEKISALMNNASTETLDSISELAAAIEENDTAIDALNEIAGSKVSKETKVNPGTGLSGGGALSGDITINHINSITAGTASGTETSTIDLGDKFKIPTITYDAQGHITAKGETEITLATTKINNVQARANAGITNIVIPQIESKDVATIVVSDAGDTRTATITFAAIDENHSIWATLI